MRTISIKLIIGAWLMLAAFSCSEDKLTVYEDVSRVYFHWARPGISTEDQVNNVLISMGYDNPVKSDSIILIQLYTMGLLSDVDRPVTAELIRAESTAIYGSDIEILGGTIPAGRAYGYLLVKINNTERMKTTTLQARIRLTPNEFFHVDLNQNNWESSPANTTSGLEYNILFDSRVDMPNLWKDVSMMTNYFRQWSKVKEEHMCIALGITRDFFMYDPATETASNVMNSRIPSNEMAMGMIAIVNRYLDAWKKAHNGQPLLDENGLEVRMGTSVM